MRLVSIASASLVAVVACGPDVPPASSPPCFDSARPIATSARVAASAPAPSASADQPGAADDVAISLYDSPTWRAPSSPSDAVPAIAHATSAGVYVNTDVYVDPEAAARSKHATVAKIKNGHPPGLLLLGSPKNKQPKDDRVWQVFDGSSVICEGKLSSAEVVSYVNATIGLDVACGSNDAAEANLPPEAFNPKLLLSWGVRPNLYLARRVEGCSPSKVESVLWARPASAQKDVKAVPWRRSTGSSFGPVIFASRIWQAFEERVRKRQGIADDEKPTISTYELDGEPFGERAPRWMTFTNLGQHAYAPQDFASIWDAWSGTPVQLLHVGRVLTGGINDAQPLLSIQSDTLLFHLIMIRGDESDELAVFQHSGDRMWIKRSVLVRGECLD